ncbi:TMEM175 family protein [Streptococcus dentiloxodontae]
MKQLKERFDTLSDAIVAIVMTILVLEIAVPASSKELPHLAEEIGLFFVAFVIIINFWYRRFQAMRATEKTTFSVFVMDVAAHGLLSLYPLAVKMLAEYDDKWIAILFFGFINLMTAFLVNRMTYDLGMQAVGQLSETSDDRRQMLQIWLNRRTAVSLISDFMMMGIALCFNTVGVYIYILTPFLEFIGNYKRGRALEEALNEGQTFKEMLSRRLESNSHQERRTAIKERQRQHRKKNSNR